MCKGKIALIGAGKVGSVLAIVCKAAGYEICGVASLHRESAQRLAARLGCPADAAPDQMIRGADLVLIATPDRVIGTVARQLLQRRAVGAGQIVFHVCGSQSAESLSCLRAAGVKIGSIHPLQSFSSIESAVPKMRGTYFAVDGDAAALAASQELVEAIGGKWMRIPEQNRAMYHAAACMASNYLVALVYGAVQMFGKLGIQEADAIASLMPILAGTLDNMHKEGVLQALTGPIVRGDVSTVRAQLAQMDHLSPDEALLYRDLGAYTMTMAARRGTLTPESADELTALFGERPMK